MHRVTFRISSCLVILLLFDCLPMSDGADTETSMQEWADGNLDFPEYSNNPEFNEVDLKQELTAEGLDKFLDSSMYGAEEYEGRDIYHDQAVNKPMNLTLGVIYAVITVVGLVANGIVFFVIFAGRETSKTVTALYVLQLAIADSIFLVTLPIFAAQKVAMHWAFGRSTCALCHTIKFVNYYAGIFFLTAMSVDRYIAVAYSTKSHQLRTRTRTLLVCAIVWFAAVLMSMPVMLYARTEKVNSLTFCRLMFPGYLTYNENQSSIVMWYEDYFDSQDNDTLSYYDNNNTLSNFEDNFNSDNSVDATMVPSYDNQTNTMPAWFDGHKFICSHNDQSALYKGWLVVNFVVGFLVPFSIISISYVLILKHLRLSESRVANMAVKKTASMRKRVTRMVAVLVICFVVCWLPFNIFNLWKITGIDISTTACFGAEQFLVALGFSNSAINPILYSFLGHSFRSRLRESIAATRRRWRRNSMPSGGANAHVCTHSNSDHSHNSFKRRLTNIVGMRRLGRLGSSSKDNERHGSHSGQKEMDGRRQKCPNLLLDNNKRREDWNSDNQTEDPNYTTRTNGMPTEITRVILADKETSVLMDKEVTV